MLDRRCACCFAPVEGGAICPDCARGDAPANGVLLPGAVLQEKYRIGRLLGRGGFGATYLGWDVNLHVRVAIKEFLPMQLAAREANGTLVYPYSGTDNAFSTGLEQFMSEARTLAKFRNEAGIIPVLDFFRGNGTAYMVLKYEDGMTLEQYLGSTGPIPPVTALQLLTPVADALQVCHAAGLIHRDISPDNIFLTDEHRVKLFDFGASRFALNPEGTNLSVILKEGFAPFEQYQRNGRQGPWTDIYALTATLYRLLTGQLPPSAPDRLGGVALPTLAEQRIIAPASLEALIEQGMALAPEQRFQNVDAFLVASMTVLTEMANAAPRPVSAAPVTVPWQPGAVPQSQSAAAGATGSITGSITGNITGGATGSAKKSRVGLFAGGGLAVAAAAAAVAFFMLHGGSAGGSSATVHPSGVGSTAASGPPSTPQVASSFQPGTGNVVDLAKANLNQAVEDQLVLQKNMVRLAAAQTALQQMGPSSGADDPTAGARQMEQAQIDSENNEVNDYVPRYMEDLRMLASAQPGAVTAAIQAVQTDNQAAAVDASSTSREQTVNQAITVIQHEMGGAQANTLTPSQISSDLR